MERWEKRNISLGELYVGQKTKVRFNSNEDLTDFIYSINTSCGCAKPKYDGDNKVLTVSFTPPKIPKHLRGRGYYKTTKSIVITYNDGNVEALVFTATIKNKNL